MHILPDGFSNFASRNLLTSITPKVDSIKNHISNFVWQRFSEPCQATNCMLSINLSVICLCSSVASEPSHTGLIYYTVCQTLLTVRSVHCTHVWIVRTIWKIGCSPFLHNTQNKGRQPVLMCKVQISNKCIVFNEESMYEHDIHLELLMDHFLSDVILKLMMLLNVVTTLSGAPSKLMLTPLPSNHQRLRRSWRSDTRWRSPCGEGGISLESSRPDVIEGILSNSQSLREHLLVIGSRAKQTKQQLTGVKQIYVSRTFSYRQINIGRRICSNWLRLLHGLSMTLKQSTQTLRHYYPEIWKGSEIWMI